MSPDTLFRSLNISPPGHIHKEMKRFTSTSPSLLLDTIYLMPISWRKLIVSTARIQQLSSNTHLDALYREIHRSKATAVATDYGLYTIENLRHTLDSICSFVPFLSLVAYFARAETFSEDSDDPRITRETGIAKELAASQQGDRPQVLNYSFLDPGNDDPVHKNGVKVPNLSEAWNSGLRRLLDTNLSGYVVLYPHFNSKKNLAYQTQEALVERTHQPIEGYPYTARDLLLHYMETGERILGPMEVRWSWKLGHLKIRTYYCVGGTEFFAGCYMHDLCIWLYNILPSTNISLRFDVRRVTVVPVNYDEIMITYDYSSFTTSLSELKHALFYLGQRLLGIKVPALDVHVGIIQLDIGEYILHYNEVVNCNSAFDLCRIVPDAFTDILYQTRSGMLGAQGNIGLSTLLHGFSVSGYDDQIAGKSVVGDDALLKTKVAKLQDIIVHARSLVDIAPEKFSTWFRPDYEENFSAEGFQYLKRPLSLDYSGSVLPGSLPDFPNVAAALGFVDEFRKGVAVEGPFARCISFIKQYTSYLNALELGLFPCPRKYNRLVLRIIRAVYRHFKLPSLGMIPGQAFTAEELADLTVTFFVPSCRMKVLRDGWLETLFSDFRGLHTYMPRCVPKSNPIIAGYSAGLGDIFECTPIRIQNIMEKLGFFRKEILLDEIILGDDTFDHVKMYLKNEFRIVVSFTCVKDLPVWYNQCLDYTTCPNLHGSAEGNLVSSDYIQDILGYNIEPE